MKVIWPRDVASVFASGVGSSDLGNAFVMSVR